ncbi:MAG: CoA transferase, partial [Gammaproteobacteria bacterium]
GWGQDGPLAKAAGHDINYISLTGALAGVGRKGEKPVPPMNLVGDFGGGGMFLAFGLVCALLEAKTSGKGQVIDAAMTDGSAMLMSIIHTLHAQGLWDAEHRGVNMLDSGSHFYDVYETLDNKFISIASLEPQFNELLMEKLQLDREIFADHLNPKKWPDLKLRFEALFKTKTSSQWCELLEGSDVCFAPVLNFVDAQHHPHNQARQTYVDVGGMIQPAPAPRFSRTIPEVSFPARPKGIDSQSVLQDWGFSAEEVAKLNKNGVLG